jgi:hypothetical protein
MSLGSTQSLTEISARSLPGGKERPVRKTENLTAISEPIVWKIWQPRRLKTQLAFTVCYRDSFTFFSPNIHLQTSRKTMKIMVKIVFRRKFEQKALSARANGITT